MRRIFGRRFFGYVPGWLALILVLGGIAGAAVPVFNGSIALPAGGQISLTTGVAPTYPLINAPNITGSSTTTTNPFRYNWFYINGDNVNDNVANGDLVRGLDVTMNTNGANVAGSRRAGYFEQDLTSTISTGTNNDYVGVEGNTYSPTAQSSPHPNLFGMFGKAQAANGGTGMNEVSGAEFDAEVDTGATAVYRWGVSAVSLGNVNASTSDAAFEMGASGVGNPGWLNGLLLDNIHGRAPIATSGCVICTDGSLDTIATGIDISPYTITGNALHFAHGTLTGAGFLSLDGGVTIGAGQTLKTQSGNLLLSSGTSGGTVAINYNSGAGAQTIFYGGGTSPVAQINGTNGLLLSSPTTVGCGNASGYVPCKFGWAVTLSAATSGSTTVTVPANSTCTLTPTTTMLVGTTNMASVYESLSSTTLTITVVATAANSQSFGGVGTCI